MFQLAEGIARDTMERLSRITMAHLPALLVALFILLVAWLLAMAVRWLLMRIFRGARIDQFLRRSGLASILPGEGPARATKMAAKASYWAILIGGFLLALSAFDTQLTSRMIEWVLLIVPKLVTGAVILVAGLWLSRYLGHSALLWAFNEGIPHSRWVSQGVRIVVVFATVVVVADYLDFARNVFLAAFILIVGGAMLAGGLALGLGGRKLIERNIEAGDSEGNGKREHEVWKHL
jgi:hypothetical protein